MIHWLNFIPDLLQGCLITILLTGLSLVLGLLLSLVLTVGLYTEQPCLTAVIKFYLWVIRGTPMLVQIFIIYYGLGQFAWLRHSLLWGLLRDPMGCAVLAFAMNTACYTTILLIGALRAIPEAEIAACRALGMSTYLAFKRILLPRAWRLALPAYSNEVLMVLKGTSLASTITLMDLMGVTQSMVSQTYDLFSPYCLAALCYLVLTVIIMIIFQWLEKRYGAYQAHR